jgi:hypothetical protein
MRPVKSSDTPSPNPRSYLPRLVDAPPHAPEEKEERDVRFQPRYVDLPALRERGHGPRNIWWGLFTLLLAMALFALAVFFAGGRAAVSVGICLLTFSALYVMAKLHLFRQRGGGFLAVSIVCLLGSLVALGERGFVAADALIKNQGLFAFAPAAAHPADSDAPLLTQSFALSTPDPKKRQVRILKDSRIPIGEKQFAIKTGDLFPYVESKDGETTFAVRDLRFALPASAVEIIEPGAEARKVVSSADPAMPETKPNTPAPSKTAAPPAAQVAKEELAQVTKSAQMEAARRYPALAVEGSRENRTFIETYKEMKISGEDAFFANPTWPIILADDLAKREGWARDSQIDAGSPTASNGLLPAARPPVNPDELPPDDLPSVIPKQ